MIGRKIYNTVFRYKELFRTNNQERYFDVKAQLIESGIKHKSYVKPKEEVVQGDRYVVDVPEKDYAIIRDMIQ